ncbi:hypothetical protein E2C01_007055 [Portunus trituberculatus]|uniref:Uncharacterized protein n=1 Tax=Portunus trituberculatus TaxID=210409 RepID=A0A5B7CX43_PORTR|nr:hypothetical protein [Portunus trituberculatus]
MQAGTESAVFLVYHKSRPEKLKVQSLYFHIGVGNSKACGSPLTAKCSMACPPDIVAHSGMFRSLSRLAP